MKVKAIDNDDGLNAKISYSITAGNQAGKFIINSDGNITVDRNLDREIVAEYKLKILAQDSEFLFNTFLFFSWRFLR